MMKQLAIAALISLVVYAAFAAVGLALYAADAIPTGATHNDCGNLKQEIADRDYGGDKEQVPQEQLKQESITCLEEHERTEEESLATFVLWSIWPAVICGFGYLAWPVWSRILHRQEQADPVEEAPRLEPWT